MFVEGMGFWRHVNRSSLREVHLYYLRWWHGLSWWLSTHLCCMPHFFEFSLDASLLSWLLNFLVANVLLLLRNFSLLQALRLFKFDLLAARLLLLTNFRVNVALFLLRPDLFLDLLKDILVLLSLWDFVVWICCWFCWWLRFFPLFSVQKVFFLLC